MFRGLVPRLSGLALAALCVLVLPALSRSEDEKDRPLGDVPGDLKQVPPDALFFVSVRLTDALADPSVKGLKDVVDPPFYPWMHGGLALEQIERLTLFARRADQGTLKIIRARKALDTKAVREAAGARHEVKAHGKTFYWASSPGRRSVWIPDDRTLVVGDMRALVSYLAAMEKPGKSHPFADGLKLASGKHTLTLAARPSLAFRHLAAARAAERARREKGREDAPPDADDPEASPDLKKMKDGPLELKAFDDALAGAGPRDEWLTILSPMFRCRRVVVTVDVGEQIKARGEAEFASEADARDGRTVAEMALIMARVALVSKFRGPHIDGREEPFRSLFKAAGEALRAGEVKRDGKRVEASVKARFDTAPLAEWVKGQRPAMQDRENLKRIGLAMHEHHDDRRHIPPQAICDKDGKPLLSWRVALLPYLGEEKLYKEFKLDEPWDGPHNKKLLARMPRVYAPVAGKADPNSTFHQVVTGHGAMMGGGVKRRFATITDGLSNTLFVIEAAKAVPWTKPEDVAMPKKGKPELGGQFKGYFHVLMCDGFVMRVKSNVSERTLRAAISAQGFDTLGDDW